jgi:hypothetical protein
MLTFSICSSWHFYLERTGGMIAAVPHVNILLLTVDTYLSCYSLTFSNCTCGHF